MKNELLANEKEKLETHLKMVAETSESLARKITRGDTKFAELAYLAGSLHDIGKALTIYQARKIGYLAHEVVSGITATEVCRSLEYSEKDSYVVVHAVLYHMQGYGLIHERFSQFKKYFFTRKVKLSYDPRAATALMKILSEKWSLDEDEVSNILNRSVSELDKLLKLGRNIVHCILSRVRGELSLTDLYEDISTLHKARILTGIVMVSDKWVSVVNRKGRGTSLYFKCVRQLFEGLNIVGTLKFNN